MPFEHNAEKPKKEELKPKSNVLQFKASVKSFASLVDGGIILRLELAGDEYITIAKLAAVKNNNELLDIIAQPTTPKTMGGNV